jgi:hypothetical protein
MVLITIVITTDPITHAKIKPIIDNINPDLSINYLNVAALMQMSGMPHEKRPNYKSL